MNTLSNKNRAATLLFYDEQLSLQEVASRLNISVSAVKGRLNKSRHQLRAQLSPAQTTLLQETKTMSTQTVMPAKPDLCCSFCGKTNRQVDMLIAGPPTKEIGVYICNECVDVCNQIVSGEAPPLREEVETLLNLSDS